MVAVLFALPGEKKIVQQMEYNCIKVDFRSWYGKGRVKIVAYVGKMA